MDNKLLVITHQWIDDHVDEIISFVCKFISFQSISGSEMEAQKWLKKELETFSFDEIDYWANDEENLRPNVVAKKSGTGSGRDLIINGHVDVVPVNENEFPKWDTNPWHGIQKDGRIFGRGSCDMKGGLTAAIFAIRALIENNVKLNGDVIFESVVGEELCEHEMGTTATVERGYSAALAIVVEPTNCEIHTMNPGAITWELFVDGKTVHNSQKNKITYPQRFGTPDGNRVGVDAFKKAMKIIQAWEHLEKEWNFRWKNPILGGGGSPYADNEGIGIYGITPAIIEAGDYIIAVPGFARIQGGLYHPTWISSEEVIGEMQAVIDAIATYDDWFKENSPELKVLYSWPPNYINKDHPGCRTLSASWQSVTGKEAIFSGFTGANDASYLSLKGIPSLTFGPGSLAYNVHGANEYIPVDQLISSAKTLATMCIRWSNKE